MGLDVDGVLHPNGANDKDAFCSMNLLREILDATNCDLVLSSSGGWKTRVYKKLMIASESCEEEAARWSCSISLCHRLDRKRTEVRRSSSGWMLMPQRSNGVNSGLRSIVW